MRCGSTHDVFGPDVPRTRGHGAMEEFVRGLNFPRTLARNLHRVSDTIGIRIASANYPTS
jgi:hypothetical protein